MYRPNFFYFLVNISSRKLEAISIISLRHRQEIYMHLKRMCVLIKNWAFNQRFIVQVVLLTKSSTGGWKNLQWVLNCFTHTLRSELLCSILIICFHLKSISQSMRSCQCVTILHWNFWCLAPILGVWCVVLYNNIACTIMSASYSALLFVQHKEIKAGINENKFID